MNNSKNTLSQLTNPKGDAADQVCTEEMVVYHVHGEGEKIGSTNDLPRRLKQQKLDPADVTKVMIIPKGTATGNEIWEIEQRCALMVGLKPEHEGNRLAVNRVRVGKLGASRKYTVTNIETGRSFDVTGAGAFERTHELGQGELSQAANQGHNRKHIILNGKKHVVEYAEGTD